MMPLCVGVCVLCIPSLASEVLTRGPPQARAILCPSHTWISLQNDLIVYQSDYLPCLFPYVSTCFLMSVSA